MTTVPTELAHKFVVVEGPIGVGKTSLARRLCTHCREPYWPEAAELDELERRSQPSGASPDDKRSLLRHCLVAMPLWHEIRRQGCTLAKEVLLHLLQ